MTESLEFNEEVIQQIFGHEAAEDERIERLKQYYFKSKTHKKVTEIDTRGGVLEGHSAREGQPTLEGPHSRRTLRS